VQSSEANHLHVHACSMRTKRRHYSVYSAKAARFGGCIGVVAHVDQRPQGFLLNFCVCAVRAKRPQQHLNGACGSCLSAVARSFIRLCE
jgi:hypothetical protein